MGTRKFWLKLTVAMLISLTVGACAKEIPVPVVVEPEPERPAPRTEGSLWPGETSRSTLFSDKKAARIGDIITVHLVERSQASNSAVSRDIRDSKSSLDFNLPLFGASAVAGGIGGGTSFRGVGNTSRSEDFTATISAMVTEVLPNGLLKVDGQRELKLNDANQYIKVTGLVRQEDINFDNSIISSKIASAKITYEGIGSLDRSTTGGWGKKLLNIIWPF
ncbi:MAG: flagellar basal body L-ring protein FlgH [Nitrospinota bacterium]|nr:flagellar basal body L-ring protein FlgH [Nitrospinota bacterium]